MKALKTKYFGIITLGVCSVRLFKRGDVWQVKTSQGTSYSTRSTPDASFAETLFEQACEDALKEHGEYKPYKKGE